MVEIFCDCSTDPSEYGLEKRPSIFFIINDAEGKELYANTNSISPFATNVPAPTKNELAYQAVRAALITASELIGLTDTPVILRVGNPTIMKQLNYDRPIKNRKEKYLFGRVMVQRVKWRNMQIESHDRNLAKEFSERQTGKAERRAD